MGLGTGRVQGRPLGGSGAVGRSPDPGVSCGGDRGRVSGRGAWVDGRVKTAVASYFPPNIFSFIRVTTPAVCWGLMWAYRRTMSNCLCPSTAAISARCSLGKHRKTNSRVIYR